MPLHTQPPKPNLKNTHNPKTLRNELGDICLILKHIQGDEIMHMVLNNDVPIPASSPALS